MINMATQTTVTLVDDLDGSHAEETIEFGLGKDRYEIDLSAGNAEKLRKVLGEFIAKGRKVSSRHLRSVPTGSSARRATPDREQNQAIREWAQARGMKVAERGRIPAEVLEAYHRGGAQKPAAAAAPAPEATPEPVRFAAAPAPKPTTTTAPRKPRAKSGNGLPKVAPADRVTRLNKITDAMIGAVCEFAGEILVDHGDTWVELRGNRDDVAAKITAVQSDMPGADAKQRAMKGSLTRVVKELRNVKSRKVEEREAA